MPLYMIKARNTKKHGWYKDSKHKHMLELVVHDQLLSVVTEIKIILVAFVKLLIWL